MAQAMSMDGQRETARVDVVIALQESAKALLATAALIRDIGLAEVQTKRSA